MIPIDLNPAVTLVLTGLGGLLILMATYYVNRFLRRRAARDAIEEAMEKSLATVTPGAPLSAVVEEVALKVRATVPDAVQTLDLQPTEVQRLVATRVSSSRSMVI